MPKTFKVRGKFDKPTLKNAVFSAIVAIIVSFSVPSAFVHALGYVEQEFGYIGRIVVGLFFGSIAFAIMQFLHYWRLSGSIRRTFKHYLKTVLSLSPLSLIVPALLMSFLGALVLLGLHLDMSKVAIQRAAYLIFFYTAVPLGLVGWITIGTWYRSWLLKRSTSMIDALMDHRSGLLSFDHWDDKDKMIRDALFSLRYCHFIFVWGINFSNVIGHQNTEAVKQISKLLKNNLELKLFVLLQCPFCEDVIERAIGLNISYDSNYIGDTTESISNCLALESDRVHVSLAHGAPYIRAVLWGRLKQDSPFDAMHDAETPLDVQDHLDSCHRYMTFVDWGGFMVQQCPPNEHASLAPLHQGNTYTHGGMWDRIRIKFAQQFTVGIKPGKPLKESNPKTLHHLARDLGMSKRKIKKASIEDICTFIQENHQFRSFIDRINEHTNIKANKLRIEGQGTGRNGNSNQKMIPILESRLSETERRSSEKDRRSGLDRRCSTAPYDGPERRSGNDRRCLPERRSDSDLPPPSEVL